MQANVASNLEAARTESRRDALVALRDTLAGLLDSTEAQVHAQLAAQYRGTLAEIAEIDGATDVKPKGLVDEVKAKREAKGRGAAAHASSNA